MGACCSGKESKKGDNQEEEIYTQSYRLNSFDENGLGMKPIFDLEVESSSLSKNLCSIITKIMNEDGRKEINLSKITLEFLWNIYRYYLEDHSESVYLLYDYRENSLKEENFLKKFKSISYKIEQMNNFTNNQFQKFRKYVKDKNIIIIAKEESIIAIEEFIYFILENKINSKIFLFDYNLTSKNNLSKLNRNFMEVMDYPNFYKFPFIFLSLRFFKHLNNNSIIFLEFVNSEEEPKGNNKEKPFLLCEKKYSDEDFWEQNILNFFRFFNVGINLKLNVKSKESNNKKESSDKNNDFEIYYKSVKDLQKNNANKIPNNSNNNNNDGNNFNYDFKIKFFEINSIHDLDDFNAKSEILLDFIEKLKCEINQKKSIVIQVPLDIDKDLLISLLFLLVWKITYIDPINLLGYLKETIFYIPGIKNLSPEKLDKLLINLENVYKMPNKIETDFLMKSSQSFYNTNKSKKKNSNDDIGLSKSKINVKRHSYYSSENKRNIFEEEDNEIDEKTLKEIEILENKFKMLIENIKTEVTVKENIVNIISTLEKIIGNILDNFDKIKFRTIKCESNTFKKFIEINTNAIEILLLFGFNYMESEKYYQFEPRVNIDFLKNSREFLFNLKNILLNKK